jgi:hypothetical protein
MHKANYVSFCKSPMFYSYKDNARDRAEDLETVTQDRVPKRWPASGPSGCAFPQGPALFGVLLDALKYVSNTSSFRCWQGRLVLDRNLIAKPC